METNKIEQKLDTLIDLTRHMLAIELAKNGVGQVAIGKHLKIATSKVGSMLKGVKKAT